jgi:hypothetical protein
MNWVAAGIAALCIAAFIWAVRHTEQQWTSDIDPPISDNHEPISDIDHEK